MGTANLAGSGDMARDALERIRAAQESAAHELAEPDFSKREASWLINVADDDGEQYTGIFTSRIPGMAETTRIQLIVAEMLGGVPYASASPSLLRRLEMFATLAICLTKRPEGTKKGEPGWFDRPDEFLTDTVPAAVYGMIRKHWEFFRDGRRRAASPGTDGDPAGAAP